MADRIYEKLGVFYLGKRFDLESRARTDDLILYDSKDLVTHAVCVGMTGSGKTGLALTVIEEAAIDGIPVLAIDPKGDLPNLLLAPEGEAVPAWNAGLKDWDQDDARIARLRGAADFKVFTPGSRAGTPLALLGSLAPPASSDPEARSARAAALASSILTLAGVEDVSPHGREQVLVASLLAKQWEAGASPDLATLVQQVQRPPLERIGVLDLETFYPARDRQELALRLNGVLAAPGFDVWLAGEPLDVSRLLYTADARPRVAIVSIAHLGDAERMMVVSLLLNAVVEWTRQQTGTTALRALIYMDEVFGYLPPTANPPSKPPLLTLLKQARAFGVGVMLSTQNPVDLDYKALSNIGTWFLGKLQTERDKARVLDGLEGAAAGISRRDIDRTLSALPGRVFLMHNVHEHGPVVFQTRWTLSYLKGPMSLEDIRALATPSAASASAGAPSPTVPAPSPAVAARSTQIPATASTRPVLPAGLSEYYLPGEAPSYVPVIYGAARVRYVDMKRGIDVSSEVNALTPISVGAIAVDWEQSEPATDDPSDLQTAPVPGATFASLPPAAINPKNYAAWTKAFEQWVARNQALQLHSAPAFKLSSKPGESERDFMLRVQQVAREQRDTAVEALRAKYAPRLARLQDKVRRSQDAVAREEQQNTQQKLQTAVSIGATLLSAFMGRKAVSLSTLGRATTAVRGVSRSAKEMEDVTRATGLAADAQEELTTLQRELQEAIDALTAESAANAPIETIQIKPQRGGVSVQLVTLAWQPASA